MITRRSVVAAVAALALGTGCSLAVPLLLLGSPAGATPTPTPNPSCRAVVFGGSSEMVCIGQRAGGVVGVATGQAAHLYDATVTLSTPAGTVSSPVVAFWNGQPPIVTPSLRPLPPTCAKLWGAMTPSGPSRLVVETCLAVGPAA